MVGIMGKKAGMTQIFIEDGSLVPVTVIEAGPCRVVQKKTREKDGYDAVQIGYGPVKDGKLSKPILGHLKKAAVDPLKVLREIRGSALEEYEVGEEIRADIFSPGDVVSVTGVTKGKGFTGSVKRHGFRGGRATHGSMFHKAPGSIGGAAFPARVFKGKKMPGRMGGVRKTVENLLVLRVDKENNLLMVKGAVPGPSRGLVMVVGNRAGGQGS